MVLFAIVLPVILAFGSLVITVGNWWVHKRHLQTQVDAAVLAAAPEFVGCFLDAPNANLAIASRALAFAGDTLRPGKSAPSATDSTTNLQVQQPNDVRVVLNSSSYWAQVNGTNPNAPSAGYGLDNSLDSADGDSLGDPCNERYLDAKATDDEAPTLWRWLPFIASPKTHAKVEIHDLESAEGLLPWAVPEIDPARVAVLFVNENNGSVFDWQYLDENPGYDNDGNAATAFPFAAWSTSGGMEPVTLGGANDRTSVVVLVSKNNSAPSMTGTLAQICNQALKLVACYAGQTQTSGASFIHAYSGSFSGSMTGPQAREVQLADSGCTAADLSAPYFTLDGNCTAAIQAVIHFGVSGDPRDPPTCALVDNMSWTAGGLGGALGTWTGSMWLGTASGRNELVIQTHTGPKNNDPTQCPNGNSRPNDPSLGVVAAPYVANMASGPIQYLEVDAALAGSGVPVGDANSVEKDNYLYTITVGLNKPHSLTLNYQDPPHLLRMASPSGSQNRAFDCDRGGQYSFEDEIRDGCRTRYIENFRDVDGDGDKEWNNITCDGYDTQNLPPLTFDPNPRPDCVMTEPGDKTGPLRGGLKLRFESPCTPNHWPDNAAELAEFSGPNGYSSGNDPRYVTLIITDDTAFGSSGSDPYPIKYFAGFYVTGWDLQPNGNGPQNTKGCPDPDGPSGPLKGNDCHPRYGCSYQESVDNGDVWGYFVDIVLQSSAGDPSDELCTFGEDPAACVAVLVE
jgi:hypothetical protein